MVPMGVVVDTDNNIATVALLECGECDNCEFSSFCNVGKGGRKIICSNNKGAKVGDLVEVGSTGKNALFAGVLNFLLPLLLLAVGIILGLTIWKSELLGFILAMLFVILYFLFFTFMDKKIVKSGKIIPKILSIEESGKHTRCASCGKLIKEGEGIEKWSGGHNLTFCSTECAERYR